MRLPKNSVRPLAAVLVLLVCASSLNALPPVLNKQDINAFDRMAVFPYSKGLDVASDFTQYAAFLTPAVFAFVAPAKDWPRIGLMYAGSTLLGFGTGTLIKKMVVRDRPYMYFDNPPQSLFDSGDYKTSFPSNHSIIAFNGAAFTASLFYFDYPDSPWRVPATAAAYGLAVTTAALRVGSGSHFLSDVGTGALIGTLTGFLVPYANHRLRDTGVTVIGGPAALGLQYRY